MSFSYQSGASLPSPVLSPVRNGSSASSSRSGSGARPTGFHHFHEPDRTNPDAAAVASADAIEAKNARSFHVPRWLVHLVYRVRNTIVVYNFLLYCFNAMLNVEIYREYMSRAVRVTAADLSSSHARQEHLSKIAQSLPPNRWLEHLYILTLMAPLGDVLARVLARNYFKLSLARSMSHASFTSSLAICTPSLNAYALLLLRGWWWLVVLVLSMDSGEVLYSALMWYRLSGKATRAMYMKLGLVLFTVAMTSWDVVVLIQLRRFLCKKLPAHVNPVFVLWDVNECFHWSSPNSIFDVLEAHEDEHGAACTSQQALEVRAQIAQWNYRGEEADPVVAKQMKREHREEEYEQGGGGGEGRHERTRLLGWR